MGQSAACEALLINRMLISSVNVDCFSHPLPPWLTSAVSARGDENVHSWTGEHGKLK